MFAGLYPASGPAKPPPGGSGVSEKLSQGRAVRPLSCGLARLKREAPSPDTVLVIFSSDAPFETDCSELRALHVSLNSPVVTLEQLPVGPASAAVAFHAGERPGVTLAVRSIRTGHLAFFTSGREEAADHPEVVLDAALSFAESMGFLFDEDLVEALGDRGPREAARHWIDLLGEESAAFEAAEDFPLGDSAFEDEELLEIVLDELASEGQLAAESMAAPALLLSKFRRVAGDGFAEPVGGAGDRGDSAEPDVRLRLTSRF